ncbi:TetR/AcrR family transcriptional regulator [Oceanobacillus jordanicus]|uniref:TetR/AcrR family transcriptional regulator n=1 Tax=Oceanobacillus jordanicus TaxID=2867266 RepID=A0AAW5B8I9_9BACI|nr:TetR/AcrR family transcriptional regulator [Oceanobacillus jordanicus]MCG3419539.1 TetR/AcrR family transcriptional regulator [Oceanobacillus jordanicus]
MQELKKADRRIRRTKRTLMKSFIQLMEVKAYHSITVKDIVDHADYNRATFYRHFPYKEALVEELETELFDGLVTAFRAPYLNKDHLNMIHLTVSEIQLFDYILEHAHFYKLWNHSEAIPGFENRFIHTIIQLFNEDLKLLTPQEDHINYHLFTTFRAYGIWGLILDWIKDDFTASTTYMSRQLIHILNYKPPKMYVTKAQEPV